MNRPRTALAINYGNYRKTCDIGHLLHAESQIMHLALVWRVWLSYTQNSVGISAKSWPSTVNKLSYPPRLCLQLSMSSMNAWSTADTANFVRRDTVSGLHFIQTNAVLLLTFVPLVPFMFRVLSRLRRSRRSRLSQIVNQTDEDDEHAMT